MRKRVVAYATAGLAAAAVLGISVRAEAADCSTYPNPVFISGSSASKPVLQALASVLGSSVSIIYQNPDSCFGLNDAINGLVSNETAGGTTTATQFLDPTNGATACTLNATTPETPDIGVSDVFLKTCQDALNIATVPTGGHVTEVSGPIQAMTFAVPSASNATAISAEAAYVVFGYDATNFTVPQWNVAANIFVRPNTSGTLGMIGAAIGLTPTKWKNAELSEPDGGAVPGNQRASTGKMFSSISGVTSNQNATIGILSYEGAMQNNASALAGDAGAPTVSILPYQHKGQTCGYLPDSTSSSADRLNVRQGRYAIWGPLHFVVNVDTNGYPIGPHKDAAALVLNYFIATGPTGIAGSPAAFAVPDAGAGITASVQEQLIQAESKISVGGVVPWCAMQVMRSAEIGAEASYQPAEPCGCYFEKTATGKTVSSYCQTCATDADCGEASPYPKCRHTFCEAQ